MRVTLDTNIYVSALHYGGKPMQLLEMGLDGRIQIAVSQPIIDESLRVLRDKFQWSNADFWDARMVIEACAQRVATTETLTVIKHDPPDNRILECAQASGSEFIVSGDQDLLRLETFGDARVVKVADFLVIVSA